MEWKQRRQRHSLVNGVNFCCAMELSLEWSGRERIDEFMNQWTASRMAQAKQLTSNEQINAGVDCEWLWVMSCRSSSRKTFHSISLKEIPFHSSLILINLPRRRKPAINLSSFLLWINERRWVEVDWMEGRPGWKPITNCSLMKEIHFFLWRAGQRQPFNPSTHQLKNLKFFNLIRQLIEMKLMD